MIQVSDFGAATVCMQWTVRISHFFLILLQNLISGWLLFSAFSGHWSAAKFQHEREAAFLGSVQCLHLTTSFGTRREFSLQVRLAGNFEAFLACLCQAPYLSSIILREICLLSALVSQGCKTWWFPQPLLSSFCHILMAFAHLLQVLDWSQMGHVLWCLSVWGVACGLFLTTAWCPALAKDCIRCPGCPLPRAMVLYFIYPSLNAKNPTIHNNEAKHYQAAEIILQLYMNLSILVYQANLLKNWVLCTTKMLHNIYAFPAIILFWQCHEPNSQGFEKGGGGPNFC